MNDRSNSRHVAFLLVGSAILLGFSISKLPPSPALLRAPATPFDRIPVAAIAQAYRLLWNAAPLLPSGACVVIRSEPRDPAAESLLHQDGVALLPGRRVLPAARWGVPSPEIEEQAEYVVVVGPRPSSPPGTLLFETPDGSLWRRGRP